MLMVETFLWIFPGPPCPYFDSPSRSPQHEDLPPQVHELYFMYYLEQGAAFQLSDETLFTSLLSFTDWRVYKVILECGWVSSSESHRSSWSLIWWHFFEPRMTWRCSRGENYPLQSPNYLLSLELDAWVEQKILNWKYLLQQLFSKRRLKVT